MVRPAKSRRAPFGGAWPLAAGLLAIALTLGSCTRPTKHEILAKSEDCHSSGELESKLGEPDDREVLAMFEQWTYHGSDGDVVFHVAQGKIIFRTTHKKGEKPKQGDTE